MLVSIYSYFQVVKGDSQCNLAAEDDEAKHRQGPSDQVGPHDDDDRESNQLDGTPYPLKIPPSQRQRDGGDEKPKEASLCEASRQEGPRVVEADAGDQDDGRERDSSIVLCRRDDLQSFVCTCELEDEDEGREEEDETTERPCGQRNRRHKGREVDDGHAEFA